MSRLLHLGAAWALAFAAGCGGADPEPAGSPGPARVPTAAPPTGEVERGGETVVVVAIDGVRADHLALFGAEPDTMPRLSALAAESVVFDSHIAASIGTNASLASIFTGQYAQSHGVGSLRDLGQHRLAERHTTLAERFRAAGFRTAAAVSLPQVRASLSGLLQGFERIIQPTLMEADGRDAFQTFHLAKGDLGELFAAEGPLFTFVHFADGKSREAPPPAYTGQFLEARLGPFRESREFIGDLLDRLKIDPASAVDELEKVLGRGRGSLEHAALRAAMYDGRLALLDEHLGALLDLLEEHGRLARATVVVVSPTGAMISPPSGGGPAFPPGLLHTPLVVRFPGGRPAGRVSAPVQPIDVAPTLADLFGWTDAGPFDGLSLLPVIESGTVPRTVALCEDTAMERRVAVTGRFQVEENSVVGTSVFDLSSGVVLREAQLGEDDRAQIAAARDALAAFARPEEWVVSYGAPGGAGSAAAELEVRWRVANGYVKGERVTGGTSQSGRGDNRLSGKSSLAGEDMELALVVSRRGLPLRLALSLNGAELAEERVFIGAEPLTSLDLPRLPSTSRAPTADDDPPGVVTIDPEGGGFWKVAVSTEGTGVAEGAEVELLLALWPPGKLDERFEWTLIDDSEVSFVPGRLDAVRVHGSAPLSLIVKKTPKRELGIAARVGGARVGVGRMRYRGGWFTRPDELALYLPDWIAGVTDPLDLDAPGMEALPAGSIRILRRGTGVAPRDRAPLDDDQLEFVRFLPFNE